MALKLSLSPRAAKDLASIRDYLLSRSPQGADNVRAAIAATLSVLTDFPRAGRNRSDLEARSVGVPRYPYTIYYRIEGEEIVVVHPR